MIDTLKYTRELESAGLNSEQAEKMVRAQMNMITDSVATKADLYEMRLEMNEKFAKIDSRFAQIDSQFAQIDSQFAQIEPRFESMDRRFDSLQENLERNLVIKLGGLMATCLFLSFAGLGLAAKFFF